MHSIILQILQFYFIVSNFNFITIVDNGHTFTDKFIPLDKRE